MNTDEVRAKFEKSVEKEFSLYSLRFREEDQAYVEKSTGKAVVRVTERFRGYQQATKDIEESMEAE